MDAAVVASEAAVASPGVVLALRFAVPLQATSRAATAATVASATPALRRMGPPFPANVAADVPYSTSRRE